MAKNPNFRARRPLNIENLSGDVEDLVEQLGPISGAIALGVFEIDVGGTKIPHGQGEPVDWFLYSGPSHDARIWQTRETDEEFIYLMASAKCTTGLAVFQ